MGCDGCLTSAKGQNQQLETVKNEARKYAIQTEQTMAVYKEGTDYFYTEAGEAIARGLPVMEFVSANK